jgi:hypothetical protein
MMPAPQCPNAIRPDLTVIPSAVEGSSTTAKWALVNGTKSQTHFTGTPIKRLPNPHYAALLQ